LGTLLLPSRFHQGFDAIDGGVEILLDGQLDRFADHALQSAQDGVDLVGMRVKAVRTAPISPAGGSANQSFVCDL
jgi:hypothetical protein